MKKCIRLAVCLGISVVLGLSGHNIFAQTNAVATGNWNTAGTWSAGVPSDTSAAILNGGFTVTLDQADQLVNLLDVGTIAGQTGTIDFVNGNLTVFDTDSVAEPNTPAIRLGQAADATGNLTMSGGQVFISEDSDAVDEFDDGDLVVGQNGTGTATISGGTLTAGDEILIGQNAGANGTVNISGGTLSTGRRHMQIGFGGADAEAGLAGAHGVVNVSGTGKLSTALDIFLGFGAANAEAGLAGSYGELNVSDTAQVTTGWMQSGFGLGSTSVINQSGGSINVSGLLIHAARGTATFDHTGGAFSANLVIIGDGVDNTPAHGTYNISGSATLSSNLVLWVGAWGKSQGIVNQNGGTVNAGALTVGRDGSGEYNLSSGILNVNGTDGAAGNNHLIMGQVGNADENIATGSGYFEQTGGTVTVKTGVFLGNYDYSEGTYKISGGTLNVNGTGSHVDPNPDIEDFIGDFSVGGALASNAVKSRVEPDGNNGPQGQALAAKGTLIVSGSAATINIAGNFLANPADKSSFRSDPTIPGGDNSATLAFEIFDNSGTSLINVGGVADLDGAVIDLDLMNGFTPAVNATFDLLKASSFGSTGSGTTQNVGTGEGFSLAAEDAGGWSLAVVASGGFEFLRATFLGSVGIAGDFNSDGKVDGRDFLLWQRNTSVGNLADWKANYGTGSLAAVSAVPEPSSLVLIGAVGILACLGRAKRA